MLAMIPALTALVPIYGFFADPTGVERQLIRCLRCDPVVRVTSCPSNSLA